MNLTLNFHEIMLKNLPVLLYPICLHISTLMGSQAPTSRLLASDRPTQAQRANKNVKFVLDFIFICLLHFTSRPIMSRKVPHLAVTLGTHFETFDLHKFSHFLKNQFCLLLLSSWLLLSLARG